MKNNSIIRGVIEIILEFLWQVFAFIIFPGLLYFLIGFFYHYYRNKTYLNIIIESIIIGFLFGFFTEVEGVGWTEWTIICISIVLFSGFFALIIRGSSNSKSTENDGKKDNKTNYKVNIKKINYKEHKLEKEHNIEDKVLKSSLKKKQENDVEVLIQQLQDNRWQNRYKAIISLINTGDSSAIDNVRELLEDENSTVRNTAATYLRANDAIPKTRPEDIELYPFNIKNSYASIERISARSDDSLDSESNIDDVNAKLREDAANLGANAIIEVNYGKGFFDRDKGVKGQGNAVLIKDKENVEKAQESGLAFIFIYAPFWILQSISHELISFIPVAIFLIIYGIFVRWGYKNKTYFLAFLAIVITSAAIWVDNILKNVFIIYDFYITTGIFLGLTVICVYEYLQRKNNTNLPWKDQWGFS